MGWQTQHVLIEVRAKRQTLEAAWATSLHPGSD